MKKYVIIGVLVISGTISNSIFATTKALEVIPSAYGETEIRVFTFKMNSSEDRVKIERLFSDQSKFIQFVIKSNQEVVVYTDEQISEKEFQEILLSAEIRSKIESMEIISKTDYYKKHKK